MQNSVEEHKPKKKTGIIFGPVDIPDNVASV